ncbi:hypothetical protein BX666DRAFT_2024875 [Dichotomocladium elegans]|nr:hypothetical protein BX666DRAFT_2024875 [Dichotomocladium elegans]
MHKKVCEQDPNPDKVDIFFFSVCQLLSPEANYNAMVAFSYIALFLATIMGSLAHVEFATDEALPGSVLNTSLGVGHGCNGSNTIALSIQVPEQITTIHPLDVAGWNLTLGYRSTNQSQVNNFTWSGGNLDAHAFQAFGVIIDIPNVDVSQQNTTLFFPAIQRCMNGTNEWIGASASDAKPAPKITITKQLTETPNNATSHDHSPSSAPHINSYFSTAFAMALVAAGFHLVF